jgi:antitoxin (DNA-binding transcriptional repressor) of toxin-antitoxin stability system
MRGGKPVAQLAPLQAPSEAKTLGQLKEMLVRLPPLGAEAAEFEDDLRLARTKQPPFPEGEPWV